jgi:hypothetical protein
MFSTRTRLGRLRYQPGWLQVKREASSTRDTRILLEALHKRDVGFGGWCFCWVRDDIYQSICVMCTEPSTGRLTLGLMGLDELHLRVLATSSEDPREKLNAQKGVQVLLDRSERCCAQRRFIQS